MELLRSESIELEDGKRIYINLIEDHPAKYTFIGGDQDDITIVEYKYSLTSNLKISEEQMDLIMKVIIDNTKA